MFILYSLSLPELPYPQDGLYPWIQAETIDVHYNGHHKAYAANMNAALQKWREEVSRLITSVCAAANLHYSFFGVPPLPFVDILACNFPSKPPDVLFNLRKGGSVPAMLFRLDKS